MRRNGDSEFEALMFLSMLESVMKTHEGQFHHGFECDFYGDSYNCYGESYRYYGESFDSYGDSNEEEEEEEASEESEDRNNLLKNGIFRIYNTYYCDYCSCEVRQADVNRHILSRLHQMNHSRDRNEDEEDVCSDLEECVTFHAASHTYCCEICNVTINSRYDLMNHLDGKRHRAELEKEEFYCDKCDLWTKTKTQKRDAKRMKIKL